jgi:hypothetical protein
MLQVAASHKSWMHGGMAERVRGVRCRVCRGLGKGRSQLTGQCENDTMTSPSDINERVIEKKYVLLPSSTAHQTQLDD